MEVTGALSEDFFAVFDKVHGANPLSLAEDPKEIKFLFSDRNHFFDDGKAWLSTDRDSRLAAFFKPEIKIAGRTVTFWGYWETTGDPATNRELFQQCSEWAADLGAETLWGPVNFSTFGNYRLKINSFDSQPFYSEPWNPSYYPGLMEELNFKPMAEYVSYIFDDGARARDWADKMDLKSLARTNGEFHFVPLTPEFWRNHVDGLWCATNEMFAENLAFAPIDFRTFENVFGPSLLAKMCPETSLVMLHQSGGVAGYCINFPDYSPLLRKAAQNSGLYSSEISFQSHGGLLKDPALLVKTAGVVTKYRKQGFPFLQMILEVLNRAGSYKKFNVCLMREGNFPSLLMKNIAPKVHRYALYSKDIRPL